MKGGIEPTRSLLGQAEPDERQLTELVRAALRRPSAEVCRWWVEPVDYDSGSPTTAGLFRARGVATDGDSALPWSLFVKLLRAWRHWPLIDVLPPEDRARVTSDTSWRHEVDVYRSDLGGVLPAGLRLPRLYLADDLGDDRMAMWLEDVVTLAGPWDLARFERAAYLLGRLLARLTVGEHLPIVDSSPGAVTRRFWTSRVLVVALPALRDDATWAHPLLAGADDRLRTDLLELAGRAPALLAALDRLPRVFTHGDASPQNLLVPADDPDGFVVIDWFFGGVAEVGFDLGQLLIGQAHAGQLDADALPAVHRAILRAHVAGLAEEGVPIAEEVVRYGFDAAMTIRSAFTALPLERLAEPPTGELADLMAARLRLTRYLVDRGLRLPDPAPA